MAATKILNISKTDSFEEVFGAVQEAEAREVILIIPRGSKLAKQAGYFEAFSKEAEASAKLISIMTEDPKVEELASLHGIHLLSQPKRTKPAKITRAAAPQLTSTQIDSETAGGADTTVADLALTDQVDEDEPLESEEEEADSPTEPEATLAAANYPRHGLRDIIKEEQDNPVRIKTEDKKERPVQVRKTVETFQDMQPEDKIEELWAEKRQEAKQRRQRRSGRSGLMKKIVSGFVVLLVVVGVGFYFIPTHAKIAIQARKESVDFRLNVISSADISGVNLAASQIPGQKFTVSKEVSETVPATGQKDVAQKAHGHIQIFNNNVGQPQRLVATTRFETSEGLVFRIPATINVPGATKASDGKISPGSIESDVYADRPGPDYNIKPSSFKIPGFKGLPQYDQFSAVSTAAMSGGIIGPSKVVTDSDFSQAQNQLNQKLKDQIQSGLKDQIADLVLIDQGNTTKIEAPVVNAKAGDAAESLNMTLRGSAEIVAFRAADLDQLVASYLDKKGHLGLAHSQLKREYEAVAYDSKTGQLSFAVHVTGQAAAVIDEQKIAQDVVGKTSDEIRAYFSSVKELSSARVVLSPFWASRVPTAASRISLTVE